MISLPSVRSRITEYNLMHKDFEGSDLNVDGTIDMNELEALMKQTESE